MSRKRILICGLFHPHSVAYLRSQENLEVKQGESQPSSEDLAWADGLLVRSGTKVDATLLQQAPRLKAVVTATVGYDHLSLTELKNREIIAMFSPHTNTISAAEHTMALILALSRRLLPGIHAVKKNQWRETVARGNELNGKTLGLIGFGRVGKRVARLAHGFEMKTLAYDPYLAASQFAENSTTSVGLDELIRRSDFVSLHVPLTEETKYLLPFAVLENFQEHAYLINTARGELLTEKALLDALDHEFFAGAALDVFEKEPLPLNSPLRNHPKILSSPHMGALTEEAFFHSCQDGAHKLDDFFSKGAIKDQLPEQNLWARGTFLGATAK